MKHSDLAHILIIHMKDSNSVSAAVSSEHMHLHRHTHFACTFSTQAEILCAYTSPGTVHFGKVHLCSQPATFTDEVLDSIFKDKTQANH